MKKKVVNLLALVALLLPSSAMADPVKCLVLTESSGAVSKFALADAPVLTYSGLSIRTCARTVPVQGVA